MRVISGEIKGKKILEPKDKLTRPLKDLVKESIFNIIEHSNLFDVNIKNSSVLDLFSGVGSFGLECLSRGAASVDFYENYPSVIDVLEKNIKNFKYVEKTSVIKKDIFFNNMLSSINKKFEIIFIDPPFQKKIMALLELIQKSDLLEKNGVIIIHRHKKEAEEFPKDLNILQTKYYGNSKIFFAN
ncbi:16S rRNA (guanine(966)-N(2))-methyltransferase RsmD [Candidatus Pelagibacter sp.]|nr:16S rRNA (guanine(966)-N(2))-methyltransferase RsmD [Candidatus Pelagibacter sp.]